MNEQERYDRLLETVRWYADPSNWLYFGESERAVPGEMETDENEYGEDKHHWWDDDGSRAREALTAIGEDASYPPHQPKVPS